MTSHPRVPLLILTGVLLCAFAGSSRPQTNPAAQLAEIQRWASAELDPFGTPMAADEHVALTTLYENGASPLWIDRTGRSNASAVEALALLSRAPGHGLDAADYQVEPLHMLWQSLWQGECPEDAPRFEVGLSLTVLRYFHDVHRGRVDPRAVGFRVDAPADEAPLAHTLRTSVAAHRLNEVAEERAPTFDQYMRLRAALAHYRTIDERGLPDLGLPRHIIRPGNWLRANRLFERLVALGDIPATTTPPQHDAYREPLVSGIAHFQQRHGLQPDGMIGVRTRAALEVPLASRIRQIELALERLRWLPPLGDGPVIALNVPMFHLWGWNVTPSNTVAVSMDAIVGRALETETPLFVGDMRTVVFRPYWNVPASILRKELLPIIARDPRFLERQHFEIVRGFGDAVEVLPMTLASVRMLRTGNARLRQRPGDGNPLGTIEFLFPNAANVYMHGTSAPELFTRMRRDFSHGCIRVEDPVALAEWVLQGHDEWTRDRITAATAGPDALRVDLARPVRVVIYYMTAAVMPENGTVRFATDIYGHDATLDHALRAVHVQRTTRSGNVDHDR